MTADRSFVHLHCHSHYSLLDGANPIPELIAKVKADGMNALALTDHGNLFGAVEFYKACREHDLNPILGYEAYVAPGHRTDRTASRMKESSFHLTLLAQNSTGFSNLIRMASKAYLEGFYYRARIDKELLEEFNEGLICLSGCASSELSNLILQERTGEAEKLVAWYQRVFGDRFYMEIQDCGLEIQARCREGTVELANRMGLPLVATNDAHYLRQDDATAHDALLCINTRSVLSDDRRMQMEGSQFYVKSPEEMYAALPGHVDAVARTQEVADRVDIDLDSSAHHYPVFTPPEQKTDTLYLRELCVSGFDWRYGEDVTDEHRQRLDKELAVIEQMGYSSYFLIVWDFVRFAQDLQIPCQARGSACGSLVAFLLGLSPICPIKHDLMFERLLDPSRNEPPDIDIDFCRNGRQAVIDYCKQKYGSANVAQIGTFGTLKAKAAIRDVGRVMSVPLKRVDEVAKMVPDTLGITLAEALEDSPELANQYESDPEVRRLIDIAMRLEGLARSAGTHAAGVVIADRPLVNYIPLHKISGKDDVVTQWRDKDVEWAGLLKMDFLGLRNLTILDQAVGNVRRQRGVEIDPASLPLDDPETFALLQRGETRGVFQLESSGMRDLLTKMKPDCFNDIIATSALYRPGPLEGGMVMTYVNVKNGLEPVPTVHPVVDEILHETYGVMVYQEQVMRILNRVGGLELSSAYLCIKAISKKTLSIIARFREEFIRGATERELAETRAGEMFDMIEKFAGYGFNKSHSTAYAAISYQTAYLKAHYPHEFMAALLSCNMENSDRIAEHIEDCRRMKLAVHPPDINRSDVEFRVEDDSLRFGLGAIKGVGEQAMRSIVERREDGEPFQTIFDLSDRVAPKVLSKNNLEILIRAGALDSLGPNRPQHLAAVDRAVQSAIAQQRDRQRGQKNLFADADDPFADNSTPVLPNAEDWTRREQLAAERAVLGFYLTDHPLTEFNTILSRHATHASVDIPNLAEGTEIVLGGMINDIRSQLTRRKSNRGEKSRYARFRLEDSRGTANCILWSEGYARLQEKLTAETVCFVIGKVDRHGRDPAVAVSNLLSIEEAEAQLTRQLAILFKRGVHSPDDIQRTHDILRRNPGRVEVVIIIETLSETDESPLRYTLSTPADLQVACTPALREQLVAALGQTHVEFHSSSRRGNGAGAG